MATVILPSLGHGALFTQAGTGASPGYDAVDDRRVASLGLQEGVYAAGSFEVTQRGAGANMSVDIAANVHENGIAALVQGDAVTGQGLYPVAPHSAVINEAITAAHATLPRIDMVVLEIQDNTHDAGGANQARVRVIDGTATAGATLDNRTGAASLPNNCLLLADVLVAATDTAIGNTEIRDRRKWARGAYNRILRTAGDYTRSSMAVALVDSTNIYPRIECSGVPVRATINASFVMDAADKSIELALWVDGAVVSGMRQYGTAPTTINPNRAVSVWEFVPAAGSHRIGPAWASSDGATLATLMANGDNGLSFVIEEIVRQNTANNATTSG